MTTAAAVIIALLAGALIAGAAFYLVVFSSRKNEEALRAQYKEDMRSFLDLAQEKMAVERVRQQAELDVRRQAVETAVSQLSGQLKDYEGLVREFEQERTRKYGALEEKLREAGEATQRLTTSTEGLRGLLSNSRARGQWGERMADDILTACGLKENFQYVKNRAQDTNPNRPDFTFLLPDEHKLNMDVKFPLDNYLRMANAAAEEEKARFKAEFLKDVKARIKEIQKRDYINAAEGTLDYVLLFIPNEQVYGFIQESLPGLIDDALKQKVVLCSPFTLYAVVAIVRQAFDNFHFSKTTQEVLGLISNFSRNYEIFRERFAKLGEQLAKTTALYEEISATSYKRLDSDIAKIEKARQGGTAPTEPLARLSGARTDKDGDGGL